MGFDQLGDHVCSIFFVYPRASQPAAAALLTTLYGTIRGLGGVCAWDKQCYGFADNTDGVLTSPYTNPNLDSFKTHVDATNGKFYTTSLWTGLGLATASFGWAPTALEFNFATADTDFAKNGGDLSMFSMVGIGLALVVEAAVLRWWPTLPDDYSDEGYMYSDEYYESGSAM